jgi:splicing factor U2AF subunit
MVEFRTSADATVAYALDGSSMEAADAQTNGMADGPVGLSIKRPKDYIVPAVAEVPYEPGVVSNVVVDTPNKISITNVPPYLSDEQITELLVSFGELKAFVLVKDSGTEESRVSTFSISHSSKQYQVKTY